MTFFTAGTETLTHTAQHLHTPSTHLHTLSHAPSTHLHTPFHAPSHTLRSWWIFSSLNNDKTKKSDAAGCRQYRYKVVKRLQMGFREKDGRGDKEVSRGNCGSCGNCTLYQFIYNNTFTNCRINENMKLVQGRLPHSFPAKSSF